MGFSRHVVFIIPGPWCHVDNFLPAVFLKLLCNFVGNASERREVRRKVRHGCVFMSLTWAAVPGRY